jgi:DNA replication licensing factor MCM7
VADDVDEALRLMEVSKASMYDEAGKAGDQSPSSKIYNLIRAMRDSGAAAIGDGSKGELSIKKVRERIIAKGFTEDQFNQALTEYALLDVSMLITCQVTLLTCHIRYGKLLAKARGSCL